ncbi:MAG: hypothetical protein LRZ84_00045 [Desertifilum sp.]|nr:hypothetical protein [Desertifilum sp.]
MRMAFHGRVLASKTPKAVVNSSNAALLSLGVFFALLGIPIPSAQAQSYPACQPPNVGEYLLLVEARSPAQQAQLPQALPNTTPYQFCLYLDELVARVGGFSNLEEANRAARYAIETGRLEAYVVQPPASFTAAAPAYNPQPLGTGFAVLVDYFNQPELATQVQQVLGGTVGLASYGQRPFLLAVHTTNQQDANDILQALSDRGFWAMIVDSRKVVLLNASVSL